MNTSAHGAAQNTLYRPYLSLADIQLVLESLEVAKQSLAERIQEIDSLTHKLELLTWKAHKGINKGAYTLAPAKQQSNEAKQTKLLDSLGATDTDKYNILVERILAGESLSTEEQKQGLELEMKLYGFDSGTFATQNSGTFA
ncbi:MAG TPA: hypothetical protein PLS40_09450 [Bacteroidia bacterium]|nr:hypothetical protein [Bacteroidia bacterium]